MGKPIIWEVDAGLEAARKLPGWTAFHKACGSQGPEVFFEVVRATPQRPKKYAATAVVFHKHGAGQYADEEIVTRDDPDPVTALLSCFDAARAAGYALTDEMRSHLGEQTDPLLEEFGL